MSSRTGPGPILLLALAVGVLRSIAAGGEPDDPNPDRALIVVGLPGDAEHEAQFLATATALRDSLTGPLGFPDGGVRVRSGRNAEQGFGDGPATREGLAEEVEALGRSVGPDGRFWVVVLGHADVRDGHARLHLPGPDLRDDEFGRLFDAIPAREQVYWITTAASGWFLPSLAKEGRIVIAATGADQEFNETEFPHALAEVIGSDPVALDEDHDGQVSVWEVFAKGVAAVEARYAADMRVPTEHARLDDNGDGRGTEARNDGTEAPAVGPGSGDGPRAKTTIVRSVPPVSPPDEPSRNQDPPPTLE